MSSTLCYDIMEMIGEEVTIRRNRQKCLQQLTDHVSEWLTLDINNEDIGIHKEMWYPILTSDTNQQYGIDNCNGTMYMYLDYYDNYDSINKAIRWVNYIYGDIQIAHNGGHLLQNLCRQPGSDICPLIKDRLIKTVISS